MRRSAAAVAPRGKAKLAKPRPAARALSCAATTSAAKKPLRKRREAAIPLSTSLVQRSSDTFIDPEDKENECRGNHNALLECARLREQLERVLVDRAQQEDEVVALRALAKSLKEEVEAIQRQRRSQQTSESQLRDAARSSASLGPPHAFFKLDVQLEELRAENAALSERLEATTLKYSRLRAVVDRELRETRLAAVKAAAELQSASSQLIEEQAECDRLRAQVARFQARSDEPVRVSGLVGAADKGKERLARAREELLLQCLAEEGDARRWRRAGGSESTDDRYSRPEEDADGSPKVAEGLHRLGDDVSALETQLRGLHASLELTRSMVADA